MLSTIRHKILVKTSLTHVSKRMPAQSNEWEPRLHNKRVTSQGPFIIMQRRYLIFVDDNQFRQRILDRHCFPVTNDATKFNHALHSEIRIGPCSPTRRLDPCATFLSIRLKILKTSIAEKTKLQNFGSNHNQTMISVLIVEYFVS